MKNWLILIEDFNQEVSFNTLEEVEEYVKEHISIREADKEFCEK